MAESFEKVWGELRDELASRMKANAAAARRGVQLKGIMGDLPHPTVLRLLALADQDPGSAKSLREKALDIEKAVETYNKAVCPENMAAMNAAHLAGFDAYASAVCRTSTAH